MTVVAVGGLRERAWREWGGLDRCATWAPPVVRRGTAEAVVVAPHPDDETLAVGGAMQRLAAAGWDLVLVVVTDGEASHPHWPGGAPALAATRRSELARALRSLGVTPVRVHHLGLPDSGVTEHRAELAVALERAVDGAALVLAPHPFDGHADHDVVGSVAVELGERLGVPVAGFGVWLWAWALPGEVRYPWVSAVRVELGEDERVRKRAAVADHRSQTSPVGEVPAIVPPDVLEHHDRPFELLFVLNGELP